MSKLKREYKRGSKGALLQNRKGTTLRQDLRKGAADIKTAFKKIKDASKSLTRGTKDLTATKTTVKKKNGTATTVKKKNGTATTVTKTVGRGKNGVTKTTGNTGTSGKGTSLRGSRNEQARKKANLRSAYNDSKPQAKDYKSPKARNLNTVQRFKFQKDLKIWKSNKPKF